MLTQVQLAQGQAEQAWQRAGGAGGDRFEPSAGDLGLGGDGQGGRQAGVGEAAESAGGLVEAPYAPEVIQGGQQDEAQSIS